jgi:hypothetical protein
LDSNRALHEYLATDLPYHKKVIKGCGGYLSRILPSRRTFDRCLATISNDIKKQDFCYWRTFCKDNPRAIKYMLGT